MRISKPFSASKPKAATGACQRYTLVQAKVYRLRIGACLAPKARSPSCPKRERVDADVGGHLPNGEVPAVHRAMDNGIVRNALASNYCSYLGRGAQISCPG